MPPRNGASPRWPAPIRWCAAVPSRGIPGCGLRLRVLRPRPPAVPVRRAPNRRH